MEAELEDKYCNNSELRILNQVVLVYLFCCSPSPRLLLCFFDPDAKKIVPDSVLILEPEPPHDHLIHLQPPHGVMDPNLKLVLDERAKPTKAPGDHRHDHRLQGLPGVFGRHHKKSPACMAKGNLRDVAYDVLNKGGRKSKAAQHWLMKDPFDKAVLEGNAPQPL